MILFFSAFSLYIRQLSATFSLNKASLLLISLLFVAPGQVNANNDKNEESQQINKAKLSDVQQAIAKQQSNIFSTNKKRAITSHNSRLLR